MLRVRIFAGPNGSGKSSLYRNLEGQFNLGYYLNPDELHQKVSETKKLELDTYGISAKQKIWQSFWQKHGLATKAPRLKYSHIKKNVLFFHDKPKSYESAILADFLRHQILCTSETFSFETVFSHPSKLDFMKKANANGYKCYLYFAAVSSPEISVDRVKQRTLLGGHDVPEDRIRSRYTKTLENLLDAMRLSYRAYLFDNSTSMKLVAEMSTNKELTLTGNHVPIWLESYVLKRLDTYRAT
jgi:predicted ABC-type ATPase